MGTDGQSTGCAQAIWSAQSELRAIWNDFDRDGSPGIAVTRSLDLNADTKRDTSRPMVGAPELIVADIEAHLEVGVTRMTLAVDFFHEDIDLQIRQLEHFADEVMTQFE